MASKSFASPEGSSHRFGARGHRDVHRPGSSRSSSAITTVSTPIGTPGCDAGCLGPCCSSIDDLADRPLPVDLLLNQNIGVTAASYADLLPASARIMAGPQYALLRPEFAALRARGRVRDGRVDRLIVFISGADGPDVTARAAEGLAGLDIPIDIVVGAAYPHLAGLRAAVARHATTTIHVNTDEMATLMDRADLAIGAPSSASWERCALGLPVVLVTMADNQVDIARLLVEAGAAEAIGWHTSVTASDIERTVRELCADPDRVRAMSEAAAAVTDGRGTDRVVAEIETIGREARSLPVDHQVGH